MPTPMPIPIPMPFRNADADSDSDSNKNLRSIPMPIPKPAYSVKKIPIPIPAPIRVQNIFDSDAAMPIPTKMPSASQPWFQDKFGRLRNEPKASGATRTSLETHFRYLIWKIFFIICNEMYKKNVIA